MPFAKLELGTNNILRISKENEDGTYVELTNEHMDRIRNRGLGHVVFSYDNGNLVEDINYSSSIERSKVTVTRFQALAALDQSGLLAQIEAIMADPQTPNITKLAWNNALEFKRLSPTVIALGATLGLTDEQLDALFTQAKSIEV